MRWGAVLSMLGLALLAGCNRETGGDRADRSNQWSLHVIGGQITLKRNTGLAPLNVLAGKPSELAMSCRPDGLFRIRLETRPETAGKPVELGAGRHRVALPGGDAAIDEAVLALLSSDQPITAKAGEIALGPFNPPFDRVTDELVDQCRKWMKPKAAEKG